MINESKDFIYGELLAQLYAAGDQVRQLDTVDETILTNLNYHFRTK